MKDKKISVKYTDSMFELKKILDDKIIFSSDENQNRFGYIEIENEVQYGIAFCNYGMKPGMLMEEGGRFWLGFGKKLVCSNIYSKKIILEQELSSVFFAFLSDTLKKYVCAVCELDLICFSSSETAWKIGFRNIICDYEIIENSKIRVECDDGEEFLIKLDNGELFI